MKGTFNPACDPPLRLTGLFLLPALCSIVTLSIALPSLFSQAKAAQMTCDAGKFLVMQ
jgi:hypothetical protein